jgi:hypothetical protein
MTLLPSAAQPPTSFSLLVVKQRVQLSQEQSARTAAVALRREGHRQARDGVSVALGCVYVGCFSCIVAVHRPMEQGAPSCHAAKVMSCANSRWMRGSYAEYKQKGSTRNISKRDRHFGVVRPFYCNDTCCCIYIDVQPKAPRTNDLYIHQG